MITKFDRLYANAATVFAVSPARMTVAWFWLLPAPRPISPS